jgi:hypothetical protein
MAATEHIASSAVFFILAVHSDLWRNALYILYMLLVSLLETSLGLDPSLGLEVDASLGYGHHQALDSLPFFMFSPLYHHLG